MTAVAAVEAASVLIVEDEALVAKDIEGALRRGGYAVAGRVVSGEEALRAVAELSPGLVLMDVNLRGAMDGIEAAARLRAEHAVPVVFLTALSDPRTLERALSTEPLGYVVKPFHETELRCAIEVAFRRSRTERELQAREEAARRQSLVDELTGLGNRRGFVMLAHQQLKSARRESAPASVLFLDLDDLKVINDEQGHDAGDRALRQTARVLAATFRDQDILARIGGDEFAVFAAEADATACEHMLARLEVHLAEHNRGSGERPLSLSVGYAVYDPESGEDVDSLLARADAEMYAHKKSRKAR